MRRDCTAGSERSAGLLLEPAVDVEDEVGGGGGAVQDLEAAAVRRELQHCVVRPGLAGAEVDAAGEAEPFKVIKINKKEGTESIKRCLLQLWNIANWLAPFLPKTSAKILECISENKMPERPLFNRLP